MADQRNNEECGKDKPDVLKIQYNKLAEDWRYFNTLLWGIPSVAIAIMAGVIIAAYQKDVTGWPRIASLGLGSFLLFALTIESIKKRQHMDVISHLIQDIQKERGLKLSDHFIFPVGLSDDVEKYLSKLENKGKVPHDKIFDFFKVFYARVVLTFVAFVSAIVVAGLTDYEFVNVFYGQWPFFYDRWPPIAIGVILPLTVFGIVLYDQKGKRDKIANIIIIDKIANIIIIPRFMNELCKRDKRQRDQNLNRNKDAIQNVSLKDVQEAAQLGSFGPLVDDIMAKYSEIDDAVLEFVDDTVRLTQTGRGHCEHRDWPKFTK